MLISELSELLLLLLLYKTLLLFHMITRLTKFFMDCESWVLGLGFYSRMRDIRREK